MIHELNDLYKFDNSIYKKFQIELDNKSKIQNNLINGIKYSDFIYIFNDEDDSANKYINAVYDNILKGSPKNQSALR